MTRPPRRSRPAFALLELLVVVAIIAMLVAILTPSVLRAVHLARMRVCGSNLHHVAMGFRQYIAAFEGQYPYGVPKPAETINHPHYETWRPDGVTRGGGTPPQQQFWTLGYIRSTETWLCPTDPHPGNYVWWDYTEHPDFHEGSSYMISEQALFGVTWWRHRMFRQDQVVDPATFGLAADGWECPNGWTWGNVDRSLDYQRIDWDHLGKVNVLFGDGRVEARPYVDAGALIRTNPLYLDPRHTGP